MLNILLLFIGICVIIAELLAIGLWIKVKRQYKKEQSPKYSPKTCVIIPCKEIHDNFKENVEAIFNQDYENFITIFVTDTNEDSAYKELKKIISKNQKIILTTADSIEGCSGKIAALIKGVSIAGEVDVYVFADSDIKPHKNWLRYLVGHLDEKDIGATTGYRWYFANNIKSYLISTWNLASVLPFFFPIYNYTWGGSTAIKKSVFEKLNVVDHWRKGFADDLILTETLKKAGYTIKFVPKCLIENSAGDDTNNFLKWGTRQFTWMKWYYPREWSISFFRVVGMKMLMLLGIFLLIFGYTLPGLMMISSFFLEMIVGWQAISAIKILAAYPKKSFGSSLAYLLLMPIAMSVIAYNYISSAFTNEVIWCGRKYTKKEALSNKI
ncbi:MAG: glycosyltransferase family 2 protein [Thermoplasmatales archaeon]|nr:MAG: glycosyltransferase family 2 protein [Thermoplasmatales archaeon]